MGNAQASLGRFRPINGADGLQTVRYADRLLSSRFQPIFSIAHRRAVGYEGLVRCQRDDGGYESPEHLFTRPQAAREQLELDRACRALHVTNFARQAAPDTWLFLNLDMQSLVSERPDVGFTERILAATGLAPHTLVIEIIESEVGDQRHLRDFIDHFRTLGCLIAIDDFGAGYSNFDRIWQLSPDIVKIDRCLVKQAAASNRVRRILAGMVSLMHEAGSLVVLEGVETEAEALVAVSSNADMVQGFYFGEPRPEVTTDHGFHHRIEPLLARRHQRRERQSLDKDHDFGRLKTRFAQAVESFKQHRDIGRSSNCLFEDDRVVRCYLLDEAGNQISPNLHAPRYRYQMNPRYLPLLKAGNANWAYKHYHYRAIRQVDTVQVSRPYLSVADSRLCRTLSQAVRLKGHLYVLCCDLDWHDE